ncbi:MAG: ribonuclease T2 family protein [Gammaproteobacteria bacterium]
MAIPRRAKGLSLGFALTVLLGGCGLWSTSSDSAPGDFDYWILALSWSPQYCKSEPADEQCGEPHGFVVHGLWPQHERGYPDYCGERERVPKELVDRMLTTMPSVDLIQRQWRKHGTCSGLEMKEYFLQVERARRSVVVPEAYDEPEERFETTPEAVEDAFIALNPKLVRTGIALQCRGRWLSEVRICLDREFQPRRCGADVDDRCRDEIHVRPIRDRLLRRPS